MNNRSILLAILYIQLISVLPTCSPPYSEFDLVILGGTIYDGTGNAPFSADIGVRDGIIQKVGHKLNTKGAEVINAGNLLVAPGFIDIHTHCDRDILKPGMQSIKNYLTQGVTTVVTGNCGSGAYDVKKFFQQLDSVGVGPNIVHLVGHNTIRNKVMGSGNREPTVEELKQMRELLRLGIEGGAAGMSSGLYYIPGAYSTTDEVIDLCREVQKYGGFYASHIRDESNYNVGLEEAVKEAIAIGEQTGVRVEISHIKALGRPVWGTSSKISRLLKEAQEKGVYVFADQYPYTASNTGLHGALVPAWARAGGELKVRLQDPALRAKIVKEVAENLERRGGPESLVIVSCPNDHRFDGKNIKEISEIINKSVLETSLYLILDGNHSVVSFNMLETDVVHFMKQDFIMTSSDGHIEIPGTSFTHPRSYGAFPRKIHKYVLEEKVINMEQAIRAATTMPADMIGLRDRGVIKEGKVADIVVFNPQTIRDIATFEKPHQYSTGIEFLLINGELVIESGIYNEALAGKPLRMVKMNQEGDI
jgi:N-acyl-D-aspartate/D-glutamate deacylase